MTTPINESLPNSAIPNRNQIDQRTVTSIFRNTSDQAGILNKLNNYADNLPASEVLFYKYGWIWNAVTACAFSTVCWRIAFRSFCLSKFGKGRVASMLTIQFGTLNSTAIAEVICSRSLKSTYREEDHEFYMMRNGFAHLVGNITGSIIILGSTFNIAQRYGLIPVPEEFLVAKNRKVAYDFARNALRPFRKTYAIAFLASIAMGALIGYKEYDESLDLLNKLGHSYISFRDIDEVIPQRGRIEKAK